MEMDTRKWEDLITDCLVNILRRLDVKMLLQDVPLVCKSWYQATCIPRFWTRLDFSAFNSKDDRPKIDSSSTTKCVKFAVSRSNGSAIYLRLPNECSHEALLYAATNCPKVRFVMLPMKKPRNRSYAIPPLITNWKKLKVLVVSNNEGNIKEIATQIGAHCKNFKALLAFGGTIDEDDADAIAAFLPKLKRLVFLQSKVKKESMVKILKGCKELNYFMAQDCLGFQEDDADIMLLASHIPTFITTGSHAVLS